MAPVTRALLLGLLLDDGGQPVLVARASARIVASAGAHAGADDRPVADRGRR